VCYFRGCGDRCLLVRFLFLSIYKHTKSTKADSKFI
jgi:hypothetical protein